MWKKKKVNATRPRGIEPGRKVTLEIAGQQKVDARVEEVGDTYAVLGLFRESDLPLARLGTATAKVESFDRRGKLEVVVTVRQRGDEPDAVTVEFDQGAETIQRRDFFRLDAMTDVVVTREHRPRVETYTLDLSASGLLLPGPPDLSMDDQVWVAIDVEEDPPVRARGRVVRVTDEDHKGVRFDLIDEAERDRLIRYLFERQRRAAQVKRG